MDLDISWIFIALPLVFALGWLASRFDIRQLRIESRRNPKAYFKGLNYLLNEQQDQAIDAFIEAVQLDPDTSELHFALGNLFRRRGEYERAVRVHQHLLARGDLSRDDSNRARHALALDFLKAGLLDRAEENLRLLQSTRFEAQAWLALLSIYERSRDWPKAAEIAAQLTVLGQGNFEGRQAHYLCEQAQNCWQTEPDHSFELIDKACTVSPKSARPVIMRATWLMQHQQPLPGFECLLELLKNMPQFAALVAAQLAQAAIELQNSQPECIKLAHQALQSIDSEHPSVDVMRALMQLDAAMGNDHTEQRLLHHLEREASLIAASQWVSFKMRSQADNQPLIRALEKATKPLQRYRCAACGFEAQQHFWQCPGCQAWDSYPPKRIEEL